MYEHEDLSLIPQSTPGREKVDVEALMLVSRKQDRFPGLTDHQHGQINEFQPKARQPVSENKVDR